MTLREKIAEYKSDLVKNILNCLSTEFDDVHYQSRENDRECLKELFENLQEKDDNLVTGLIHALETYFQR